MTDIMAESELSPETTKDIKSKYLFKQTITITQTGSLLRTRNLLGRVAVRPLFVVLV